MTKRFLIGLVTAVVLVAVAIASWYLIAKNSTSDKTVPANTQQTERPPIITSANETTQSAKYSAYKDTDVANDKNTKLLFFHAPWCPQCRALDADIAKNISTVPGVSIYKVDYDTNQALRKKYGVTLQTTVVRIDDSGKLIEKYVAYNEPTFANVKANLL